MDIRTCPHCQTRVLPSPEGQCPQCQGNVDGAPAAAKPRCAGAISRFCPACGSKEFREIRAPAVVVRFVNDRICAACGCRYRPPTPLWASVAFIVIGLLLASFMGYSAMLQLQDKPSLPTVVIELLLALLGVVAFVAGLSGLGASRRQPLPSKDRNSS
jgi:hypothetical protein